LSGPGDVLELIRQGRASTRGQVLEVTGLSRMTVAQRIDALLTAGLVVEGPAAASTGGRRPRRLRFNVGHALVLAATVDTTHTQVALTDLAGRTVAEHHLDVAVADGPSSTLDAIGACARRLVEQGDLGDRSLCGIGISVPGPVDPGTGRPSQPPIMPGWDGYPVRDAVSRDLGCPVVLDNDVNVLAVGEQHAGVARNARDFLYVKIGTGIGCGIVVGGRVYRGVAGTAGDIGHIKLDDYGPACACGEVGCLEAYFGGAALARDALTLARSGRSNMLAATLEERGRLTASDVGGAAAAGDFAAANLVREGGRRLGHVIASLVSFLNPGMVVIGGGVSRLGHPLLAEVRSSVYRRSLPLATGNLPIVLSELGDLAGVTGAAWSATDHTFN